jgi:NhaA family Na+:H+ antiporter
MEAYGVPGSLVGGRRSMAGSDEMTPHGEFRRPWSGSERRVPRLVFQPVQSFLHQETSGALILLGAAAVALLWANSPWWETYEEFWHTKLTFRMGGLVIYEDLRHWINDSLMALFFLVVGLEIKRELTTGELRDTRKVVLPALAALGGMVVPALVFLAFTAGKPSAAGWGIPMATDIAFALGVLTIAARRAPPGLKPFLLTLAIVDDIGAILVIAIFYSEGIAWSWLTAAIVITIGILVLKRIHVRWVPLYVTLGIGLWFTIFESGVHATIAGVVLGLLTPATPFQRPKHVSEEARRVADETVDDPSPPDADSENWLHLAKLSREAVSPLARFEEGLHPWTSLVVIPLFALANAGIHVTWGLLRDAFTRPLTLGIIAGLVVGKLIGISGMTSLARRLGLGQLPEGTHSGHVLGVASVAGVGFTVALFIADLAFEDPILLEAAKTGILTASILAGILGALLLRRAGRSTG